jgi:hypothetical protein
VSFLRTLSAWSPSRSSRRTSRDGQRFEERQGVYLASALARVVDPANSPAIGAELLWSCCPWHRSHLPVNKAKASDSMYDPPLSGIGHRVVTAKNKRAPRFSQVRVIIGCGGPLRTALSSGVWRADGGGDCCVKTRRRREHRRRLHRRQRPAVGNARPPRHPRTLRRQRERSG